jgi:hypothetical protein
MTFPESVVEQAWRRAGGRCECRQGRLHSHLQTRCDEHLIRENRGRSGGGGWEACRISTLHGYTVTNCQILCWHCHQGLTV